MKRFVVLIALMAFAAGLVGADELGTNKWDSYFKNGDTVASLGVGVGLGTTFSVAGYPGFEQVVYDVKLGDIVPLSIGVAAKGLVGFYLGGYNAIVVGAGAFVPFHFSLRGLDLEIFNKLDFYVAPGLALSIALGDVGWGSNMNIGFGEYAGVNYFLSDTMAVYLEQVYWGNFSGGTIGITLKL